MFSELFSRREPRGDFSLSLLLLALMNLHLSAELYVLCFFDFALISVFAGSEYFKKYSRCIVSVYGLALSLIAVYQQSYQMLPLMLSALFGFYFVLHVWSLIRKTKTNIEVWSLSFKLCFIFWIFYISKNIFVRQDIALSLEKLVGLANIDLAYVFIAAILLLSAVCLCIKKFRWLGLMINFLSFLFIFGAQDTHFIILAMALSIWFIPIDWVESSSRQINIFIIITTMIYILASSVGHFTEITTFPWANLSVIFMSLMGFSYIYIYLQEESRLKKNTQLKAMNMVTINSAAVALDSESLSDQSFTLSQKEALVKFFKAKNLPKLILPALVLYILYIN